MLVWENFATSGARRGDNWTGKPTTAELTSIDGVTHRGFTFQERLDNINLTDFNGRIYGETGQFFSPDPYISDPTDTQSYNRYSYARNNPLRYTDPSGYLLCFNGGVFNPPSSTDIEYIIDWFATPDPNGVETMQAQCENAAQSPGSDPGMPGVTVTGSRWSWPTLSDQTQQLPLVTAGTGATGAGGSQGNQAHHYGSATPATCTPSDAFSALKAPGVSAPGAPAAQENVSSPIDLWPVFTPNQIVQVVNTPNMTLVNIALPGHVFQGTVTTQVTPFGTGSLITTSGAGVAGESQFRGVANDIFGALWFGLRNEMISDGCDAMNGIPTHQ